MKALSFIKDYALFIIVGGLVLIAGVFTLSYAIIDGSNDSAVSFSEGIDRIPSSTRVGIVFGGGINGEDPTPLVRERLDTAARLLNEGYVEKLILSGDNRFIEYNEPTVMLNYLVDEKGVDPGVLQEDFAGRSTYETCERANKVFGLTEAVLISQNTHLPRAIYLCNHFSIQSYGVISEGPASTRNENSQVVREVLARTKALFNAHIYGEQTILGDPITL